MLDFSYSLFSRLLHLPKSSCLKSFYLLCYILYSVSDCGQMAIPAGGSVEYMSGTTYSRVVTYTCNPGYDLIGPASVTCQEDGTWSYTSACRVKGKQYLYSESACVTVALKLNYINCMSAPPPMTDMAGFSITSLNIYEFIL